jgi:hypothetical protein
MERGNRIRILRYEREGQVRWVPVTTAWQVLGSRIEGRPPAIEVSCEYIE